MARPCKNDHEFSPDKCRLCQLIHVSEDHRRYWDEHDLPKAELPGVIQQAINIAKATAEHVAMGMKAADDEMKRKRLAICDTCEFFNRETSRCHKCGCLLNVKTAWAEQHCPIGKW